jgi:carbonic anhydrase
MVLDKIFESNKTWVKSKLDLDKNYFNDLAKGQTPEILYIGCSDSRVSAELFTGLEPGQVFVHRNIANMVPDNDLSSAGVINYAIAHLGVKHVVVCGHTGCGGVKAAMGNADLGVLNPWLDNIKDVQSKHSSELDSISNENDKYNRLIELNTIEQALNVVKTSEFKEAKTNGGIEIHSWVFDLSTGSIIDLDEELNSKM